jgi:hypothetical protein
MSYESSSQKALYNHTLTHTFWPDGYVHTSLYNAEGWFVTKAEGYTNPGEGIADVICRNNDAIYDEKGWVA